MKETLAAMGRKVENGTVFLFMLLLALLPAAEMVARIIFKTGVPSSMNLIGQILVVVGMVTGMITAREGEHLNIALVNFIKDPRLKRVLGVASATIAVTILTIFAWSSVSFVLLSFTPWKIIGFIPDQVVAWIMPFGYAVMALRMAVYKTPHSPEAPAGRKSYLPLIGILIGSVLAIPALVKIIWGFEVPALPSAIDAAIYAFYGKWGGALVILLIISALAGTPLFVVLGSMALFLIARNGGEFEIIPNQAYTQLTMTTLPAIPLFTLTGFMLSESKAGERLIGVFRNLVGWIPGGMIIAAVAVCAFFTTFTGGSGVTILALGGLLSKILIDNGKYPRSFTLGLLTAVGSIGILFPPSLPIILVGASTTTSILKMFAGGMIPGLILMLAMIGYGIFAAVRHHVPVDKFTWKGLLASVRESIWEILLPIWLIVGYMSGLLSIVEAAAMSVIYTIVIEVFVNRDIAPKDLSKVVLKSIPIIGGIVAILASSQALSYFIVDAEIPQVLITWVKSFVTSPYVFLLLLNVALIVAGAFMEIYASIIILLPLVAPLGAAYGLGPVHIGIIFLVNMEVGFLFPPVGLNILLASYRFKAPFTEITRSVLPFLAIQFIVVMIVSYVPFLTEFLAQFV